MFGILGESVFVWFFSGIVQSGQRFLDRQVVDCDSKRPQNSSLVFLRRDVGTVARLGSD